VHGEAGLAARKGHEHEGARLLRVAPFEFDSYSTLVQGMGAGKVEVIETLMEVSRIGYGLLASLVVGEQPDIAGVVGRFPPADVLVIGYAGGLNGKRPYPFERKVDCTQGLGEPPEGATWKVLVHARRTPEAVLRWYLERKFELHGYADDLGRRVRSVLLASAVSLRQRCVRSQVPPGYHDGRGTSAAEDESWDESQAPGSQIHV
jgi:hypothetical protein